MAGKGGTTGKTYITGATGKLGAAVLKRVDAIPLVRSKSGLKNEIVTDFSSGQLKEVLADAAVIIHIAGSVDTLDGKKMQEANVGLTKRIVDAAPERCRIVFSSSISVYGKQLAKKPADENTPVNPDSLYAKTKYGAESFVARRPEHVILRIGPIYGPGFTDYYRVLSMIENGKMTIIGDGENRIPFVHVDDAADAVAKAAVKGSGTYVIAGDAAGQKEVFGIAARELGVEAPSKRIGTGMALFFASLGEWRYRLGGRKPTLTLEHVSILVYDRPFDCTKAKRELGFSPRPLKEGIKEMVREYKKL